MATTNMPTATCTRAKPNIVAGAYTNSEKGAKETALFNIDGPSVD